MKIYNTLTRKKEDFKTIDENKVRMYVCGPTVYDFIHIGNARPMIVFDAFRRYLEFLGYQVTYVSNFTDIDDKIINRANELKITSDELSKKFIVECKKDMDALNILPATNNPLATNEIPDMINLIEELINKDYAYVAADGTVYYDTSKFEQYGKLSHKNIEDLQAGFRELKVTGENNKKNYADFVLWKPKKEGEPFYKSPWCDGRPGWHTECCVMAPKYCGGRLDIHAGGEDLIFPHHENEIAQYEAVHNDQFSTYWMHNAFLNINNQKMSKSLGNFFTVRDILDKFEGKILRFFMLSTHYRSMLNFSFELMESAKISLTRIENCIDNIKFYLKNKNVIIDEKNYFINKDELDLYLKDVLNESEISDSEKNDLNVLYSHVEKYFEKLDDDFNTSDAIAQIFEIVKIINQNSKQENSIIYLNFCLQIIETLLNILGIDFVKNDIDLNKDIEKLIEERSIAKKNKDFKKADEIREKLKNMGIELEDTREGVKWKMI